jgi:hypothetical protein
MNTIIKEFLNDLINSDKCIDRRNEYKPGQHFWDMQQHMVR